VNPNTIIKAYNELEIRGSPETQQGAYGIELAEIIEALTEFAEE